MAREKDEEREFIENIERLLAGEEVTVGREKSEDYRTAFDFARKLTESRSDPSPVFKQQLKDRLLLRLTEREMEVRQKVKFGSIWEFLANLVPRSPVWRTAAATLVIVLVTVGVLWRTGMFTREAGLEELARESEQEIMTAAPEAGLKAFEGVVEEEIEAAEAEEEEAPLLSVAMSYTMPQDPESAPPSLQGLIASAQYSIDGGPVIDTGPSEIHFLESGMQHIFRIREIISEDAVELTFIITGLGELHGPWEYIISLQE